MILKNYKDLKVWRKAYQLCLEIYKATKGYPKDEVYGLTSQMRRSSVSIPCNIAEGYGRKSRPEYMQFLYIAYGSTCELATQIMLSEDLGYIKGEGAKMIHDKIEEIERMLMALIKSLAKPNKGAMDLKQ